MATYTLQDQSLLSARIHSGEDLVKQTGISVKLQVFSVLFMIILI